MNKLKVFTFVILISLITFHIYAGGPQPPQSVGSGDVTQAQLDLKYDKSGGTLASGATSDVTSVLIASGDLEVGADSDVIVGRDLYIENDLYFGAENISDIYVATMGSNIASSSFTNYLDQNRFFDTTGQKTMTGSLAMSNNTVIEISTGTLANLSFRFRTDPVTGFYSSTLGRIDIVGSGSLRGYFNVSGLIVQSAIYSGGRQRDAQLCRI